MANVFCLSSLLRQPILTKCFDLGCGPSDPSVQSSYSPWFLRTTRFRIVSIQVRKRMGRRESGVGTVALSTSARGKCDDAESFPFAVHVAAFTDTTTSSPP